MKIEHVAVYVRDLEAAKNFFVQYFDGQANDKYTNPVKGFASYFIRFSDGSRLELMTKTDVTAERSGNTLGFAHISFGVGSKENVLKLTERLRGDGYKVTSEPRVTGDGYFESCILDGEGNLIEITI